MCTSLSLLSPSSSSSSASPSAAAAAAGAVLSAVPLLEVVVAGCLTAGLPLAAPTEGVKVEVVPLEWPLRVAAAEGCGVVLGWGLGLALLKKLPGVVGAEAEAPAQETSTGEASRPGISLPLTRTELKNFSAVLRSLKVISVEAVVVWMSVNSPMPWGSSC